jgi:4-hydroxy-2-oxoheptanedioate aldolase
MSEIPLIARLRGHDAVIIVGLRLPCTNTIAVAKSAGVDCVYVDLEHGNVGAADVMDLGIAARSAGLGFLVRVPNSDPSLLSELASINVEAILIPGVVSDREISRLIETGKVPKTLGLIPIVESTTAVENVYSIAALPSVWAIQIGTVDLCTSYGIAGQFDHAFVRNAYQKVIRACIEHGKSAGIGGLSAHPDLIRRYIIAGARFVSVGTDSLLLERALKANTAVVRMAVQDTQADGSVT